MNRVSTVGEPGTAINLAVTRGLYAVPLGDGSLSNMTAPITPAALANPDVRLRVWFDDGEHGSRQLTPDQRVVSVAYAMMAADVEGGAWRMGGNASTTPGEHFLGTTDSQALELRANSLRATVPGGSHNAADGSYSLAAGQRAKALHQGAFVWGDSTAARAYPDHRCRDQRPRPDACRPRSGNERSGLPSLRAHPGRNRNGRDRMKTLNA